MRKLLICDLDNTLYDWVLYYATAFRDMLECFFEQHRLQRDNEKKQIIDQFKEVFSRDADIEKPFSMLDIDYVINRYFGLSRMERRELLDQPLHAFNKARKRHLSPYPGVIETLSILRDNEVSIAIHTESRLHSAVDRLTRLGMWDYITHLYCRQAGSSVHPDPDRAEVLRSSYPTEKIRELLHHQRKPNKEVIFEICQRERVKPSKTVYIGDILQRDMLMALEAGTVAVWAKYGTRHERWAAQFIEQISPWTEEEIAVFKDKEENLEKPLKARGMREVNGFREILSVVFARQWVTISE
jgi:FMN phosphatase YigB (HAD superfamily)